MYKVIEIIFKVWKSLFRFFRFKTKEFLFFIILCMVVYYLVVIGFKCELSKDKFNLEIEKKSMKQEFKNEEVIK